jgi:hypothetical protein
VKTLQTLDQHQVKKQITAISVQYESARVAQTYGQSNVNLIRTILSVYISGICAVRYATPWQLRHTQIGVSDGR